MLSVQVMPNHIVALLQCARVLEHFFVPLIFNDNDERWDSAAFWNIPSSLPPTLRSFRGFDAQTPLRFVHQCISNLPNIEEFHIVLYFGSHHPDYIACRYTGDTLHHLATHCVRLRSFEGYFDSTHRILEGIEQMVVSCPQMVSVGLLFHPDVADQDIAVLIEEVTVSIICRSRTPTFSQLTENPNQHVQLRVVEISFCTLSAREALRSSRNGPNGDNSDGGTGDNHENRAAIYGTYNGVTSEHLKSLDEIETSEDEHQDEDDDLGLDERSTQKTNSDPNNHHVNGHNIGSQSASSESSDDVNGT